jgi:glycerophosphoryl diester phosphodiesterase
MPMATSTPTFEAIAHRGVRDRYPENTIPAFQAALDFGADAIELDVHATSDGVVVVHHYFNLPVDNTSTHAGRAIADVTSRDLETFELTRGVGIPTLDEALRVICRTAKAYIEVKARHIESLVAQSITNVPGASEKCAVHSFDHRIVNRFALVSDVPTGVLIVGYPMRADEILHSANARDFWENCEFIDRDLITTVHASGGRVIAWTCNEPAEWDRLIDAGVDGICTDRVGDLVSHRSAP